MTCYCGKKYRKERSPSGRWVYTRTCRCGAGENHVSALPRLIQRTKRRRPPAE